MLPPTPNIGGAAVGRAYWNVGAGVNSELEIQSPPVVSAPDEPGPERPEVGRHRVAARHVATPAGASATHG